MPGRLIFQKAMLLCLSFANGNVEELRKDTAIAEDTRRMNLRGEELRVISCSLCRGPAKALRLCQNLPFCFNYPISMIQAYVRALRSWSCAVSLLKCNVPHSLSVLFYLVGIKLTFHL